MPGAVARHAFTHAGSCQPVVVQNPIFPEPQELLVKCGCDGRSHDESIYTTEIGGRCR